MWRSPLSRSTARTPSAASIELQRIEGLNDREPRYGEGAAGAARRLRHDQPQDQHPAHRLRRGLPGQARHREPTGADAGRAQGEPLCHHRPAGRRRPRPVGPHRRGAGGRAGLGYRSIHARRARRQALRPRHLRHEGVSGLRARHGAGSKGAQAQDAVPLRLLLRRGDRLHRRAADDCRAGQVLAAPAHGVRRRAEQNGRGRRPQGSGALARRADGPCRALEHAALRRQCHRLCRPADRRAAAHGGGAEGLDAQSALRPAVDDHADHPDRGRHGLQRRAGALLVRLGDAGACRASIP